MGYTVPEWMKDEESTITHFVKLFKDYIETFEEDFKEELEEK